MSPDMVKWQLSLSKSVQGIVTDKSWECRLSITYLCGFFFTKTWMYPSTNSTGKSASSIRQLMVRMLRATLLRDIAPSTES